VIVSKSIEFDAGHRVPSHDGKCRNPHGHRYRVVAYVRGPVPESGMVVDFGVVKQAMTTLVHDRFDHTMIVHRDDRELLDALDGHGWLVVPVDDPPTAENLAALFGGLLGPALASHDVELVGVDVWETPTSRARWTTDG